MDCIKQGVTTIFDHHASYAEIPGSLHTIAESAKKFGIRSCLCYEVSDRDGEEKCLQAIQENADFITECERNRDPMLAAMFGGHALFTISDKTFDRMVAANNGRTGYHIHVSEGMNDVYDSLQNYGRRPVQRLQDHGILDVYKRQGQRTGAGAHRRAAGPDGRPAKADAVHSCHRYQRQGLYLRHDGQHPSGGRLSDGAVYVPLSDPIQRADAGGRPADHRRRAM